MDAPAPGFDSFLDDAHSDASAGVERYAFGRRQALVEDQLARVAVIHRAGLLRREKSALDGALLEARRAEADAVVGDGDKDRFAIGLDADRYETEFVLADHATNLGWFDTVDNGVSEQMDHRLDEGVKNQRVDLCVGRLDLEDRPLG